MHGSGWRVAVGTIEDPAGLLLSSFLIQERGGSPSSSVPLSEGFHPAEGDASLPAQEQRVAGPPVDSDLPPARTMDVVKKCLRLYNLQLTNSKDASACSAFENSNMSTSASSNMKTDTNRDKCILENDYLDFLNRKEKVQSWVLEELEQHIRVFSIVGFPGIGKTMLADELYNVVKCHFGCTAFVSGPQNFNFVALLEKILEQFKSEKCYGLKENELITQVRGMLKKKCYFLVIDDLWDVRHWKRIKSGFVKGNDNSVILVTTRICSVGETCFRGGECKIEELHPLNDEDACALFNKKIYGGIPTNLQAIAKKI